MGDHEEDQPQNLNSRKAQPWVVVGLGLGFRV